jgi:hypothetical protein
MCTCNSLILRNAQPTMDTCMHTYMRTHTHTLVCVHEYGGRPRWPSPPCLVLFVTPVLFQTLIRAVVTNKKAIPRALNVSCWSHIRPQSNGTSSNLKYCQPSTHVETNITRVDETGKQGAMIAIYQPKACDHHDCGFDRTLYLVYSVNDSMTTRKTRLMGQMTPLHTHMNDVNTHYAPE